MSEATRIKVRETPNEGPNSQWCVDGEKTADGKRKRSFFPTRKQAEAYAQQVRVRLTNEGLEGKDLSRDDRRMAAICIAKLAPKGRTLIDATNHFLDYLERVERTCTIAHLADEVLAAKRKGAPSLRYLKDIEKVGDDLTAAFGNRYVSEILPRELDDWLSGLDCGQVTRNWYRRMAGVLFSFAFKRGYCAANPIQRVERVKEPAKDIEILTPEQTEALLKGCAPEVVPFVAIGAFAGLRREEIRRLDWASIHLNRSTPVIEVRATNAKTKSRRTVPIQPNLAAWLKPHAKKSGPVAPDDLRNLFDDARRKAGFVDPKKKGEKSPEKKRVEKLTEFKNHLRHSYGSYRLPIIQNDHQLAQEMGNSPGIIYRHYRELVHIEDAQRFWNIYPTL